MSTLEPFVPRPYHFPEDIHNDAELHIGPVDGPDVLQEPGEPEPSLDSLELNHDIPLRRPTIGESLTVEELTAETAPEE
jgi:hypothetical protein